MQFLDESSDFEKDRMTSSLPDLPVTPNATARPRRSHSDASHLVQLVSGAKVAAGAKALSVLLPTPALASLQWPPDAQPGGSRCRGGRR